ncbi:MAG: sigma-54-dependent Fis family transcriptional regulator [Gammaproteobacteria bacterium]|nr:sigma-54-dependent Fis family transcriptional regulator [Gammaproteobacteria bacterium]
MAKPTLLLSVIDTALQNQLEGLAESIGFKTIKLEQDESWLDFFQVSKADVVIIQLSKFTEADLAELSDSNISSRAEVIFISNGEPNPNIDKAMQLGIPFNLKLPIDIAFMEDILKDSYAQSKSTDEQSTAVSMSELDQFGLLVGSSTVMRKTYRMIKKAAESELNIFITGESGAGKELVARTVHLLSERSEKPFIAVNCGALSPELVESELFGHVKGAFTGAQSSRTGVFEQAEDGVLFLDEVTEMPLDQQVKLLRVLESGEYRPVGSNQVKTTNVRVISATNRVPQQAIQDEIFREDLFFRLSHFPIDVPPLRERGTDIVGLAKHFLAYRNASETEQKEISLDSLDLIANHSWPGNVRELKHVIERAYILANNTITPEHIILNDNASAPSTDEAPAHQTVPAGISLEEIEKRAILKTLEKNDGNKATTAKELGVSTKTLYNKLDRYSE